MQEDKLIITRKEFLLRRKQLFSKLPIGSTAIIPAAQTVYKNSDVEYIFRQDSDFWYLTGFNEPNAIAILYKNNSNECSYCLFVNPKNVELELWTGPIIGLQGACEQFLADEAYSIYDFETKCVKFLQNQQKIFWVFGKDLKFENKLLKIIYKTRQKTKEQASKALIYEDLKFYLHQLRQIKSQKEINILRYVCEITAIGHNYLMRNCKPGLFEYQLAAMFYKNCIDAGCEALAYPSIVGGAERACILHYISNRQKLSQDSCVLIDAGGEWQYYAADVTRTFPVNGKFSAPQKEIYNLVLMVQKAVINIVKPGIKWSDLQNKALEVMVAGLLDLGIITGNSEQLIKNKAYRAYYMHSIGHWLGLDVHDVGSYYIEDEPIKLQAGMVFTVEPGLYFPINMDIPKHWQGIGVRIEDDILVTETGCEVLTAAAIKEIDDIEQQTTS